MKNLIKAKENHSKHFEIYNQLLNDRKAINRQRRMNYNYEMMSYWQGVIDCLELKNKLFKYNS